MCRLVKLHVLRGIILHLVNRWSHVGHRLYGLKENQWNEKIFEDWAQLTPSVEPHCQCFEGLSGSDHSGTATTFLRFGSFDDGVRTTHGCSLTTNINILYLPSLLRR